MDLARMKQCLAGLYGAESMQSLITEETGSSLSLYFNDIIPVSGDTRKVRSVRMSASSWEMIDDPDFPLDQDRQVRIPQIRKYFPASIAIRFHSGPSVNTPISDERDLVKLLIKLYPARLTIDQLIAKTEREAEELRLKEEKEAEEFRLKLVREAEERRIQTIKRRTLASIRIDRDLVQRLVSEIVLTSRQTPGCDIALVGKGEFLQYVNKAINQTIFSLSDELGF